MSNEPLQLNKRFLLGLGELARTLQIEVADLFAILEEIIAALEEAREKKWKVVTCSGAIKISYREEMPSQQDDEKLKTSLSGVFPEWEIHELRFDKDGPNVYIVVEMVTIMTQHDQENPANLKVTLSKVPTPLPRKRSVGTFILTKNRFPVHSSMSAHQLQARQNHACLTA
jgi:hypothetical protein